MTNPSELGYVHEFKNNPNIKDFLIREDVVDPVVLELLEGFLQFISLQSSDSLMDACNNDFKYDQNYWSGFNAVIVDLAGSVIFNGVVTSDENRKARLNGALDAMSMIVEKIKKGDFNKAIPVNTEEITLEGTEDETEKNDHEVVENDS
jgi:hypothetical protein